MIAALPKYHAKELERRKSSPLLMVHDTAFMCAISDKSRERLLGESDLRGHVVESAVGAYLLARSSSEGFEVFWWREGNYEVDFVLQQGTAISAIEVKSGAESRQSGMLKFLENLPKA